VGTSPVSDVDLLVLSLKNGSFLMRVLELQILGKKALQNGRVSVTLLCCGTANLEN
jgi:hypothetical protein